MNINGIINQILGLVTQIGSFFGKTTGLQIGGPLVTGAIIIFLIWKYWHRMPKWVRIGLIVLALSMFSGGIGNILQGITKGVGI